MARRVGLASSHAPMAALVALACAAGGAGVIWHGSTGEALVERSQPQAQGGTQDAVTGEGQQQAGDARQPAGDAQQQAEGAHQGKGGADASVRCLVHVDGAVKAPGVVELKGSDLRVFDAVQKAGGSLDDADTSAINLAEPLADGAKIHIPHEGEQVPTESVPAAGQAETAGATGVAGGLTLVNINTASAEELQTLTGVGEATAAAIIQDREQNGPFASPEDLMRVSGIGEKKFAKVQGEICV